MGWFLHCLQLLLSRAEQIYGDDEQDADPDLEAMPKLSNMIENLTEKFANMELNDMGIEKHADYNKSTVQGQVNALRVDSLKNCYEALIEYIITHGADKNTSRAGKILALFIRHQDLSNLLKACLFFIKFKFLRLESFKIIYLYALKIFNFKFAQL